MKFKCTTELDLPLKTTVELFTEKSNLKYWQKELVSTENTGGAPGKVGEVTKLKYKSVTIIETIIAIRDRISEANGSFEITGTYEHKRGEKTVMIHQATNRFSKVTDIKTLFELEMEFVAFMGFIPKMMGMLMGGMVKKYYQSWLTQFRNFAEKQATIKAEMV